MVSNVGGRFKAMAAWLGLGWMRIVQHVDLDRLARSARWLMRKLGPRLRVHAIARANLVAAYPEKSDAEIERILSGMWDNVGRVIAEYAHLHRLWDYDPDKVRPGRIVVDEESRQRFLQIREDRRPVLFFGAHLANWELLIWADGALRRDAVVIYRRSKLGPFAKGLLKVRKTSKAALIAADEQVLFKIKAAVERGALIATLVDQHLSRGVDVLFFGRPCRVSPILARFARQYDCPIHGMRMVRLPDARLRFEITGPIAAPRDKTGQIDIVATMQTITNIVEDWVREYPEQWVWFYRRWR